MSRTVLVTIVRPAQSLKPDNLRLWWCPLSSRLLHWLCTACLVRWSLLHFLWSVCSIPSACVRTSCSSSISWASHLSSWAELPRCHVHFCFHLTWKTSWKVSCLSGFWLHWENSGLLLPHSHLLLLELHRLIQFPQPYFYWHLEIILFIKDQCFCGNGNFQGVISKFRRCFHDFNPDVRV